MASRHHQPSFLAVLAGVCVLAFLWLCTDLEPEQALLGSVCLFSALALPYLAVVGMIRATRVRPKPKPKAEVVKAEPSPPSRSRQMAEARGRYEATLRILDASGLGPAELRAAKEKAKRLYMKALDELL